ncbi:MAG TPA: hypothetical protein VGV15_04850, partial [Terriglobales bacterium]|nr:hypothetical protein [Terriglobales bacterium]
MRDPLADFDWTSLYGRYDSECLKNGGLASNTAQLSSFQPRPTSDRTLYYALLERFAQRTDGAPINLGAYEGMLYWKLYTQPAAVANVCKPLAGRTILRDAATRESGRISKNLPPKISKTPDEIIRLVMSLTKSLTGMASSCAIPVRTTFLHFLYPDVVPIFDKQVLKAVGVNDKGANQSYEVLREYV